MMSRRRQQTAWNILSCALTAWLWGPSKLSFLTWKPGAAAARDSLSYCEDCVKQWQCQRPLTHWQSSMLWPLLSSISQLTNCSMNLCCHVNLWLSDAPLIRTFCFFQYSWDKPKHLYSTCSPCKISRAFESGQLTTWRGLQIYDKFTTTDH